MMRLEELRAMLERAKEAEDACVRRIADAYTAWSEAIGLESPFAFPVDSARTSGAAANDRLWELYSQWHLAIENSGLARTRVRLLLELIRKEEASS